MIYHRCDKCGRTYELSDDTARFICGCGTFSDMLNADANARRQHCIGCQHLVRNHCRLYLRPCSTLKLWRGLIDPPAQCPAYSKLAGPSL